MKKTIFSTVLILGFCASSLAQAKPATTAVPQRGTESQRPSTSFDLATYGVSFDVEPRLIVMMAALEAAGFEAAPAGTTPSDFRTQVRKDIANLDPDLQARLRVFYERNKLPAPATAADQAARYISLALALGPPPLLEAPERSDQLPGSLLEVLDFAPLVREFYRRSGMDEKLVAYTRAYQAEGDRLRPPTTNMVQSVLSYLHTRPTTDWTERILVKTPGTKKNSVQRYTTRQHDRHFFVVPDLLGVSGAINFRVIGDDYYAVVPEGTDPISSELRRGYLQYVIDPLVLKFNRQIADRREQIRQVIAEREKAGATVSPDVFLTVSRSLVAAADARFDESRRIALTTADARAKIAGTKDDAARQSIVKESQAATTAIQDQTIARLADDYERGAVLAFFFADQLKEIESAGFDIANFFPDMIASFDPARETNRLTEFAEVRKRALAARQARLAARNAEVEPLVYSEADAARAAALVKQLGEIEKILQAKDYPAAEMRLKELLKDYSREPRIFFALAQTSSVAAADATDEDVQARRLQAALTNYRLAVEAASPETDRALISRARVGMGRIYAFLEKNVEAAKEFDEAIRIGEVAGGAYREAVEGRNKLPPR